MQDTTLGDVNASIGRPLIQIDAHAPLKTALNLMRSKHITKLAVFGPPNAFIASGDPSRTVHNGKKYIGVLTLLDVVVYALRHETEGQCWQALGQTEHSMSVYVLKPSTPLSECLEPMGKVQPHTSHSN